MKMSKKLALLLSASMFFTSADITVFAEESQTTELKTIEYIIQYETNSITPFSSETSFIENLENNLTNTNNIEVIDEINSEEGSKINLISVNTADETKTTEELNETEGIVFAEPNYKVYAYENDTYYENQWGLNGSYGISAENAWEITTGDEEVIVAVIDTGVDISHPDLAENIFTNMRESMYEDQYYYGKNYDNDGNGYIDDVHGWDFSTYENPINNGDNAVYDGTIINDKNVDSHGTHIAGIIAAGINGIGIQGVAPNVTILPIKFMNGDEGTVFNAIKSIEYAEMMGAAVVNCSWGSQSYSQFLYNYINNSEMLFVCAAGNDGVNAQEFPEYPAMYELDNIISVGATDETGGLATFSNYGQGVNIAAPGKNIYSTLPENTYGYMDGTSMAAPFVTGAAALLLSNSGGMHPYEIKRRIMETKSTQSSLKEKIDSGGILNVNKLLSATIKPINLTEPRYGAESVVVNGEFYVMGGYNNGKYLDKVEKFSPQTNSWENVKTLVHAIADFAVGVYDGKIYTFGGFDNYASSSVYLFDAETKFGDIGCSMPSGVYGSAYIQVDDKMYIIGGIGQGYKNTIYEYNFVSDTWAIKQNLPCNLAYASAEYIDGTIYIMGGNNEDGCSNKIYSYNISNDTVTEVAQMEICRKDFATEIIGNKIYIFGGSNTFNTQWDNAIFSHTKAEGTYIESLTDSIEVFDTKTNKCEIVDTLQKPIMGMTSLNYYGRIYLFGGWSGVYENDTLEYIGTNFPKNIHLSTQDGLLTIKWEDVPGAIAYNIEFDNVTVSHSLPLFNISIDEGKEYKIRLQTVTETSTSLWSDYIYYSPHRTLSDAKTIEVNSAVQNKMYKTGQTCWYKLNNYQAGTLSLTLSNIPEDCKYTMQLCDLSGKTLAVSSEKNRNQTIENFSCSQYNYYIRVHSNYGFSSQAYTLTSEFTNSSILDVPERIRASVTQPSSFSDTENDIVPHMVDDGAEIPGNTDSEPITVQNEIAWGGNSGISNNTDYTGLNISTNLQNSYNLTTLSNTEENLINEINGQIPSNSESVTYKINNLTTLTPLSTQNVRVVVNVFPENADDSLELIWNNNGENFRWNNIGDIYYLTTTLGANALGNEYYYTVKLKNKAASSEGRFTVKVYAFIGSAADETFEYTTDDVPIKGRAAQVSHNSNTPLSMKGVIDHPYDRDIFQVYLSKNDRLSVHLKNPEGVRYFVSIYDNTCIGNEFESSQFLNGWCSDTVTYADIIADSNRTYMVMVTPDYYNPQYSASQSYTLDFYKRSSDKYGQYEINNEFENADIRTEISSKIGSSDNRATEILFNIDSPVDIDRYRVPLNAGDKLSVMMQLPEEYNDTALQYRIEIHSLTDNNMYISRSYNNPNSPRLKYVTFIADTTDTYYVAIKSLNNSFDCMINGSLKITHIPKENMDTYENKQSPYSNDFILSHVIEFSETKFSLLTASELTDGVFTACVDNELDVDWYTVKTDTDAIKRVYLNSTNLSMVLLDSDMNIISTRNSVQYNSEANKRYYIGICVADNSDITQCNYTLKIEDISDNTVPEVTFQSTESNHYYIFDDHPEFIRRCDLVTPASQTALMHKKNLENGATYTVFAYHHISNVADGRFDFGQSFDGNTSVYFDGVFYTDKSIGANVTITKFGIAHCNWDDMFKAWDDFKSGKIWSFTNQVHYVKDDYLFLSDLLDNPIRINQGNDMGYVAMMMEFVVDGEGLCYADVAYTNKTDAKQYFGYSTESCYENLETIKGVAETSQTVIADEMRYTIDNNTPRDSFLPVYVANQINGRTKQSIWTTNISPLTTNNRWTAVQSSEFPLEYDGQAVIRSRENGVVLSYVEPSNSDVWVFDTEHSKNTESITVPEQMRIGAYADKTTFSPGERLDSNWLSALKDIEDDTPFVVLEGGTADDHKQGALIDGLNGFGITYQYTVYVNNVSNRDRKFSMMIQGNKYNVSYSVNDGEYTTVEKRVKPWVPDATEAFNVNLPKGEETKLSIKVTLMAGSNPVLHNAFVIDAEVDDTEKWKADGTDWYEDIFYKNLNEHINK